MFGKKTLPAQIPRNPPEPDFEEKWKGNQRHQKLRLIFDSVFKGYFSDGLPLLSVATSDVDASSSGDSDPPAHDSKNLVRQKSRLFPTMFHILPPRTPKVMAYLRSAALKLFFCYRINWSERFTARNGKNTLKTMEITDFYTFIPGPVHMGPSRLPIRGASVSKWCTVLIFATCD